MQCHFLIYVCVFEPLKVWNVILFIFAKPYIAVHLKLSHLITEYILPNKAVHYNPPVITRFLLSWIHLHFNYNYNAFFLTASCFWRMSLKDYVIMRTKVIDCFSHFSLRCFASYTGVNLCQDLFSPQENIMEVIRNQEFLLLPAEELHKLLASDDVNVPDEETIFHALMMWVKYDMQRRCSDLSMLLAFIRLPLLPPQVILCTSMAMRAILKFPAL